ncbi:MAG: GNAT family N-acetyltransferase [Turneriella sp.]|nr:GNAT family N-acetyltransferase [Leptospiraceae bacterium]MCX7633907.1 GNAT family N-acetyltransferase [Turneriella sp.]
MEITIRPLAAEDFAAWLPHWKNYQRFFNTEIPDKITQQTWKRIIDPNEPVHALGAFSDNTLMGFAHMIYHRSCWTQGDYCYLQDLYTAPEFRRQGIGQALLEAVFAKAKADGIARVHWLTHETNVAAQRLYDKLAVRSGFIQYRKVFEY